MRGIPHPPPIGCVSMSSPFQSWVTRTVGALSRRRSAERTRALRGETRFPAEDERDEELRRLSTAILKILELNHDASSALSAALIDAEFLTKLKAESPPDQVREVASEVAVSLLRLKDLINETRRIGQSFGEPEAALGASTDEPPDGH
jgi:hypothetical protein